MAHKTRVSGTNYEITGGKVKRAGTNYDIACGKVKRAGTNYDISFFAGFYINDEKFSMDDGMTWYDWVDSDYFKVPTGYNTLYITTDNVVAETDTHFYYLFNHDGTMVLATDEIRRRENYDLFTEE